MKLLVLSLFLIPLFVHAQTKPWAINDDHSEVFFQLSYLGQGEVTGRFTKFGGQLDLEGEKPKAINLWLEADSIDSGNKMRDNHLRSNDFLRSKAHPLMTFESSNINEIKPNTFWTLGNMTVGGEKRLVKIQFELTPAAKDTWNFTSRFAKWKGKISRKDFNITWNKTLGDNKFLVGDSVSIWGSFQLQPGKGTPSSKHMIPDTKYIREREKVARGEATHGDAAKLAPKNTDVVAAVGSDIPQPVKFDDPKASSGGHTLAWWIWFSILGMMGFFSSIILGLHSKKVIADNFKYSETGIMGHVSDFVTIIYVVIYSVAYWYIGWG